MITPYMRIVAAQPSLRQVNDFRILGPCRQEILAAGRRAEAMRRQGVQRVDNVSTRFELELVGKLPGRELSVEPG